MTTPVPLLHSFDIGSVDARREVVAIDRARVLLTALVPAVQHVRLGGKSWTKDGVVGITDSIGKVILLRSADLSDMIASRPEDEAKEVLAAIGVAFARHGATLTSLDLSDNALGLKGVQALAPLLLASRAGLKQLVFNNNGLEGRAARLISLLMTSTNEVNTTQQIDDDDGDDGEIEDDAIDLDDEGQRGMIHCTTLERFHTFNNLMECRGAAGLGRLLRCSPLLTDLRISSTRIGGDGAASLAASLGNCTAIAALDLSDNSFGCDGVVALCESVIARLPSLRRLNMAATAMGDDGVAALSKALLASGAALTHLDLSCNELTSDVCDDIEAMLAGLAPSLQEFRMSENEIGSVGAAVIMSSLAASTTINTIDLSVNEIGASGAVAIANLLPINLHQLELNGNLISAAALETLAEVLPDGVLGDMDMNDDECDENEDDLDLDRITAAVSAITLSEADAPEP